MYVCACMCYLTTKQAESIFLTSRSMVFMVLHKKAKQAAIQADEYRLMKQRVRSKGTGCSARTTIKQHGAGCSAERAAVLCVHVHAMPCGDETRLCMVATKPGCVCVHVLLNN